VDTFYIRANKLQDELLGGQKQGLESEPYEVALHAILEELYELVGRPGIKRLNELNIPEQLISVWWCLTPVFCLLPRHAIGPIPSDVIHLLICHLFPRPSNPNLQTIEKLSMVLVLQPDADDPSHHVRNDP